MSTNAYTTAVIGTILLELSLMGLPKTLSAQDGYRACYIPEVGAVYRIGETGLPAACLEPTHVEFSFASDHGVLAGLDDDDHLQYVHAEGARKAPKIHAEEILVDRELQAEEVIASSVRVFTSIAGSQITADHVRSPIVEAVQLLAFADGTDQETAANPDHPVTNLQGNAVSAVVPEDGQLLRWNSAESEWTAVAPPSLMSYVRVIVIEVTGGGTSYSNAVFCDPGDLAVSGGWEFEGSAEFVPWVIDDFRRTSGGDGWIGSFIHGDDGRTLNAYLRVHCLRLSM